MRGVEIDNFIFFLLKKIIILQKNSKNGLAIIEIRKKQNKTKREYGCYPEN